MTIYTWEYVAAQKRERLAGALALTRPPCDLPTKSKCVTDLPRIVLGGKESMIVHLAPELLLSKLASGELSAVEVTVSLSAPKAHHRHHSVRVPHSLINS